MKLDKAEILARLDAATVASHYGIAGRWGGRWLRSRSCGRDHHDRTSTPTYRMLVKLEALGYVARDSRGRWHARPEAAA